MGVYYVTSGLLKELGDNVQCEHIASGPKYSFVYDGKFLIPTSGMYCADEGKVEVWAHEAVPLEFYDGEVKPMRSGEHHYEVTLGNRERGYPGQIIDINGKEHVFIGPTHHFKLRDTGEVQGKLF